MDNFLLERASNHLKKLASKGEPMSTNFLNLARQHNSTNHDSEGEWVAPKSDLSALRVACDLGRESGSDESADEEERKQVNAAADTQRPRGPGTRWDGKLRMG